MPRAADELAPAVRCNLYDGTKMLSVSLIRALRSIWHYSCRPKVLKTETAYISGLILAI